jgi:hypothetical protein
LLELEEFKFSFLQVLFYTNEYLIPIIWYDSFSLQLVMFSTSILCSENS